MDLNTRRLIGENIKKSGLNKKDWFQVWYSIFGIMYIVLPLGIGFLSDKKGYFNVEGFLISFCLYTLIFFSGVASYYMFKKEGDSRSKLVWRALTLPVAYLVFGIVVGSLFALGDFIVNKFY